MTENTVANGDSQRAGSQPPALPPIVRVEPIDRSRGSKLRVDEPVRLTLQLPIDWNEPGTSRAIGWPDIELQRLVARLPRGYQEAITMETKLRQAELTYTFTRPGTSLLMACVDVSSGRIGRFGKRLTYCNKTLVDVADGQGRVPAEVAHVMGKTGEPVEIRPMMVPENVRPGGDFAVKVYAHNTSPAGATVSAIRPDGSRLHATTDRVGTAIFSIDRPGPWTFRFEHDTDQRVFVGDLVFTVADASVPHGGVR